MVTYNFEIVEIPVRVALFKNKLKVENIAS